jgi:uncharacterized protein
MLLRVETLLQAPEKTTHLSFREALDFPTDLGRLTRPLTGDVTITRTDDDRYLQIQGALTTEAELLCDRCLGPVPTALRIDVDEVLEVADSPSETLEVDEAVPVTGDLDLSDLLRQHVLLNLPSRKLCGCEPTFGKGASQVDPRWQKLEALLSRTTEEDS